MKIICIMSAAQKSSQSMSWSNWKSLDKTSLYLCFRSLSVLEAAGWEDTGCSKRLRNARLINTNLEMQSSVQQGAISAQGWIWRCKVGSVAEGTLCARGTLVTAPYSILNLDMRSHSFFSLFSWLFSFFSLGKTSYIKNITFKILKLIKYLKVY